MNTDLYVPLVEKCPDNDFFGIPQIVEADMQAKRDPGQLTDRQLEIIATYAYADAQVYARQRAEARAKAAAPAAAAAPSKSAAPARRFAELARFTKADDLETDEGFKRWLAENRTKATPIWLWKQLFDVSFKIFKAQREKREDLEARVERLESMLVLQTNQIRSLETSAPTRGLSWAGEHAAGQSYRAGEFCKHRGSVWLATTDTQASPGSTPGDWQLIVKGQAYS